MADVIDLMTYKAKITLDDKGYNSGLDQAEKQFGGFKSKMDKLGGAISKAVAGGLVAAGAAITAFGAKSVMLASNLQEVQNVVDTTFGNNADLVDKWAKDAASSFGMSELSAKKFNGTMGAMLKSMGLTDKEVLNMSTSMVGLAGDMASFYNLDGEEAFNKIRAGISGETEPLKQLGINMSVANLEAFALSQGINKAYGSMTQAEQAALRYSYLMSVSADAQGDFAKTSDSLSNQMRIAKLKIEDLSSRVGTLLIPIFNDALASILRLVDKASPHLEQLFSKIAEYIPVIQNAISKAFDFISSKSKPFIDLFNRIVESFSETSFSASLNFGTIKDVIASAIDTISAIVDTFAAGFNFIWDKWGEQITEFAQIHFLNIIKVIQNALDVIKGIAEFFTAFFTGDWEGCFTALKDIAVSAWSMIQSIFKTSTDMLKAIVKAGFTTLGVIVSSLMNLLWTGLKGIWNNITEWFVNSFNGLLEWFTSLKDAFFEVGSGILTWVWEGLQSVWESVYSWVSEKVSWLVDKLAFWRDGQSEMSSSSRSRSTEAYDGSHATGLSFVPFDGYRALLHKGEAVLRADQNPWNPANQSKVSKVNGGYMQPVVQNITLTGGDIIIHGNADRKTVEDIESAVKKQFSGMISDVQRVARVHRPVTGR